MASPYQAYAGDRDDSLGRSGSATPIIDEEARLYTVKQVDDCNNGCMTYCRMRMISMEKQLSTLSNLVASALTQKNAFTDGKDLESLRLHI